MIRYGEEDLRKVAYGIVCCAGELESLFHHIKSDYEAYIEGRSFYGMSFPSHRTEELAKLLTEFAYLRHKGEITPKEVI